MKRNDHYHVSNASNVIIYRATTGILSEEYVLSELIKMFENTKQPYKIFKNDKLIHRLNYLNHDLRRTEYIKDMDTGEIYQDCHEMAEQLGCTYVQAKQKLRRSFRYKLIKRDII